MEPVFHVLPGFSPKSAKMRSLVSSSFLMASKKLTAWASVSETSQDVALVAEQGGVEDVLQAHHGAFGVAPWGGDGAAGALFRQHGGAVRDWVPVFHHPPTPQGGQLPVKGGRAAGEVVCEVVAAELRRVPGRFPKCFRGQQEKNAPFI